MTFAFIATHRGRSVACCENVITGRDRHHRLDYLRCVWREPINTDLHNRCGCLR